MTPWMNEGFFSDAVVLVEGEDDRAALLGAAASMGHDWESVGISVIPCMGKNNIDRPAAIFSLLGIPVYCVWDNDHGKQGAKPDANRALMRLMGRPPEDWPCCCEPTFAVLEGNLEKTLAAELGQAYQELLGTCTTEYCFDRPDRAIKNPVVMGRIVSECRGRNVTSATLQGVVGRVAVLRNIGPPPGAIAAEVAVTAEGMP